MAGEKKSQSSLEHEEDQEANESPPHKVARLPSDEAGIVTMAAPSPLMLGLGLGLGREQGGASKPAFTFMQLQELEHQALIFKYMTAGLPVPVHLVAPIWKSIAASSFASYRYPSFMGYGSLCLDYRNSMEPEPGRCRRTDGKKWRCSRDVVPDQKYCERHMHRGRNRPRKTVEGVGPTGGGGGGGATASAPSRPCGTQLSISVSAGGREAIDPSVGISGSGGHVSSPELGLSHSGSACKTATFKAFS